MKQMILHNLLPCFTIWRFPKSSLSSSSSYFISIVVFYFYCCLVVTVYANRDDSYNYINDGTTTIDPFMNRTMYWHDAQNVLTDLQLFSSLSIKFHSCVWSPSSASTSSNNNNNNNNNNDNDYWYLGSVPDEQANVAFSLYGTLIDEHGDHSIIRNKCDTKYYINSFYTTAGLTSFLNSAIAANVPLYNKGVEITDISTECNIYTSTGIACSASQFVQVQFNASSSGYTTCHASEIDTVINDLYYLNRYMKDVSCTEIYNVHTYSNANGNLYDSTIPLSLLSYSASCSLTDPLGDTCPNPYKRAISSSLREEKSFMMLGFGSLAILIGLKIVYDEHTIMKKEASTRSQQIYKRIVKEKRIKNLEKDINSNKRSATISSFDSANNDNLIWKMKKQTKKKKSNKLVEKLANIYHKKRIETRDNSITIMDGDEVNNNEKQQQKQNYNAPTLLQNNNNTNKGVVPSLNNDKKIDDWLSARVGDNNNNKDGLMKDGVEHQESSNTNTHVNNVDKKLDDGNNYSNPLLIVQNIFNPIIVATKDTTPPMQENDDNVLVVEDNEDSLFSSLSNDDDANDVDSLSAILDGNKSFNSDNNMIADTNHNNSTNNNNNIKRMSSSLLDSSISTTSSEHIRRNIDLDVEDATTNTSLSQISEGTNSNINNNHKKSPDRGHITHAIKPSLRRISSAPEPKNDVINNNRSHDTIHSNNNNFEIELSPENEKQIIEFINQKDIEDFHSNNNNNISDYNQMTTINEEHPADYNMNYNAMTNETSTNPFDNNNNNNNNNNLNEPTSPKRKGLGQKLFGRFVRKNK